MPESTTRSFRLNSNLSTIIDDEADRMGISVNAMMNIVLKQYCECTRFQSKLDMIILNREIFTTLLNLIDDDEVYNLGIKLGETIPHDIILFWKKKFTLDTIIEYMEKIICRYGYIGTFDEIVENDIRIIIIRHRLGSKGSSFLKGYLKSLFNHLDIEHSIDITNCSIKIQFKN